MSPIKDKCGIEGQGVASGSQEVEWDREGVLYAASAQQAFAFSCSKLECCDLPKPVSRKNVSLLSSVPSSCPQAPAPINVPVGPRECSPTTPLLLLLEQLATSLILFGFFFS